MDDVTFLGDVFLPEPYTSHLQLGDFVCNLEYPITSATTGWPDKVNLKADENHLAETFGHAPLAVSLANNHVMDYGREGIEDTLAALEAANVEYFGAGQLSENCHNPLVVDCGDRSLGLAGYVCESTSPVFATEDRPGVRPIDPDIIGRDIATARDRGADDLVVYLHMGAEEVQLPKPADVLRARRVVDAGADLVVSQHAHRIQPFETYGGGAIFYGVGNCIMPDLDVPAYYDADGTAPGRFQKRQRRWNRRSLAIRFASSTAVPFRTTFENGVLSRGQVDLEQYRFRWRRLYDLHEAAYAAVFRTSYAVTNLNSLLRAFAENPQVPRLRHLRTLKDRLLPDEYD